MEQTAERENVIVFNDQPQAEAEQRNDTDLEMQKKDSLKRIALKTELMPIRSSTKSLVTKNILNEAPQEEVVFDGGLKLTLNPEKSKEHLSSGDAIVYEPGKRRKNRMFLPPLVKNQEAGNREEIKVQPDKINRPFVEPDSSADIVLKSDREHTSTSKLQQAFPQPIYRISSELPDKKTFMMSPVPSGLTLQCTIRRDKSTFSKRFYTEYTLQISENFQLLAIAKRLPYHCNSTYAISLQPNHFEVADEQCIGQLRSNFWGSLFEIHEVCSNRANPKLVATVKYESSCCQPSGPRRMSADVINSHSRPEEVLSGSGVSALGVDSNVTELVNKQPRYDEARKAYVMKFGHRVKRSSVKNFILVKKDEGQKNMLLFGKCNKEMFNMDISHPLTPMQAFAIALTSVDSKLVSQ